jgi:murein lipoprotein
MTKVLLALTSAALLAMTGCASTDKAAADAAKSAEAAKQAVSDGAAKVALTAEAAAELVAAELDVKKARNTFSLWTTADSALKAAEEAAKKGDSATVLKQAKLAREHVRLALEQNNYPMIKIGD